MGRENGFLKFDKETPLKQDNEIEKQMFLEILEIRKWVFRDEDLSEGKESENWSLSLCFSPFQS